ncbi:MAG: enoyl-CoA hydratase/isomerase family protein [Candidatus Heimdallarchaeota archaeon]
MNNSTNPSDNGSTIDESVNSVLFEVQDHIGTITINRPKKMNALRLKEFDSLIRHLNDADKNSDVHVILIRSSGNRAFSGGLDLNMVRQFTPEDVPKLLQHGNDTVRAILQAKKPVVVEVQGPAVAWGTILCLAADFVIAGENPKTFFSLPEIDIGLFPATGALTLALFSLGFRRAKRILMIPEKISLKKAEEFGIVTQICPIDSLEKMAIQFCQNLASKPQGILIPIKALINNFHIQNLEQYFDKEAEMLELSMSGDQNKMDEFIERLWKIEK